MGTERRIDSGRAERLLDGTDGRSDPVARLLAAAQATANPDEVRREGMAIAAFRTARYMSSPAPRPARARRAPAWANVLGIKAAVIAFTILAAGVALAAGTGVLPTPFAPASAPASTSPLDNSAAPASSRADGTSFPGASSATVVASERASSSPGSSGAAVDHASLVGLCHAYRARGDRDPGAAIGDAGFAALVAAAGGADKVEEFCTGLLGASPVAPSGSPSAGPGKPNADSGNGGAANDDGTKDPAR
jgi:hypothetical protein